MKAFKVKNRRENRVWLPWGIVGAVLLGAGVLFLVFSSSHDSEPSLQKALEKVESLSAQVEELEAQLAANEEAMAALQRDAAEQRNLQKSLASIANQYALLEKRIDTLSKRSDNTRIKSEQVSRPRKAKRQKQLTYHIVRQGETLYRIGKRYKMTPEELIAMNGLSKGAAIYVGQKLRISR